MVNTLTHLQIYSCMVGNASATAIMKAHTHAQTHSQQHEARMYSYDADVSAKAHTATPRGKNEYTHGADVHVMTHTCTQTVPHTVSWRIHGMQPATH